MPHVIPRAERALRAVVVGAGPGGLEAARVLAERGHAVTLFEASPTPGGQIRLAERAPWRKSLGEIGTWLAGQVERLGVRTRYGQRATADDVMAADPDVVVLATGGLPNKGEFAGADLAVSTWQILDGSVAPAQSVLLYDDQAYNQAPSCAEYLLAQGASVEIVTPERALAEEMTGSNYAIHLRNIYRGGGRITPDMRLLAVRRHGNRLIATLQNEYSDAIVEREVDQVVAEHGTLPDETLYHALRPHSRNLGEVDLPALVAQRPQHLDRNPAGRFRLFRVGDAVASRDIHAAIFDSLRLCLAV